MAGKKHEHRVGMSRWFAAGLLAGLAFTANAATTEFVLDDIFLDSGHQLTGSFTWTYTKGDFENGVGTFDSLVIPRTTHTLNDVNTTIDLGQIEITLGGPSVHDDGIDISLFLLQDLSPIQSSQMDLTRSKYAIGGNGFFEGAFISGSVTPTSSTVPLPAALPMFVGALGLLGLAGGRRIRGPRTR